MTKAEIYYVNFRPEGSLEPIHRNLCYEDGISVKVPIGVFKSNWRRLPIREPVLLTPGRNLERLFAKYNTFSKNPYSPENDPGQKTLKRLKLDHAPMNVGDVIRVRDKYWMVSINGFKIVRFI